MKVEEKLRIIGRRTRVLGNSRGVELALGTPPAGAEPALVVFAANHAELSRHEAAIFESARADRLTWVAYPKAGQLGTDLSRDDLWATLLEGGIRVVTSIAIDEVWTGLRFRPSDGSTPRATPAPARARAGSRPARKS